MSERVDVVIAGGGIIGLASAFMLAGRGLSVAVCDRGELGKESTWAGAGILSPINPGDYPAALLELLDLSLAAWPTFGAELEQAGGQSIELVASGLIRVAFAGEEAALQRMVPVLGRAAQLIDASTARALEPALSPAITAAIHQPEIHQVRNPRLIAALVTACARRGVRLFEHRAASRLLVAGDRVTGVATNAGEIHAAETVVAAGAWSRALVASSTALDVPVTPSHGVLVCGERRPPLIASLIIGRGRYIVPRRDGTLLVGSTVADRGFDTRVPLGAVAELSRVGIELLPELAECAWRTTWAGLRPASPDRLPFLGRPATLRGLIVATGHGRNGVGLAPITARVVADLVSGVQPAVALGAFACERALPNSV